jgi:tetratricopeptide (TPR) repeat protein
VQLKMEQHRRRDEDYLAFAPEPDQENETIEDLLDRQIERHRQAVHDRPNGADLQYRYALLLRGRGDVEEARRRLQTALEINPSFSQARIKLGLILLEQQHNEKALDQFKQAWRVSEEFVRLHYKLALMYCDKIHFALAVERFELTQDVADPSDAQANLRLALQNMGLVDRAAAIWRGVCELEPDSPMAFQAERSCALLNKV